VAKRLTLAAPHTARHATLRPATTLLPRLALTDRPSRGNPRRRKPLPPISPAYHQKDYSVPTPKTGTDTSLLDRESRREAYAQALDEVNAEASERYAQREQEAVVRKENMAKREHTLTLEGIAGDGDPLLRSVTPEYDLLTPAVVREGMARQRSQKIYQDMKEEQQLASVASIDETVEEVADDLRPPVASGTLVSNSLAEKPEDESYIPEEPVDPSLSRMAAAPE
jgi:hypothetical protein